MKRARRQQRRRFITIFGRKQSSTSPVNPQADYLKIGGNTIIIGADRILAPGR